MSIAARKRIELQCKIASLQLELTDWRNHSRANQRLAKHYSQIRRLSDQLNRLISLVQTHLEQVDDDESELLKQCSRLEAAALELHWIWGFFRNKFALRSVEWFSPYLSAIDELAWECYKPARQANTDWDIASATKEPPLVFFSNKSMPFTLPRAAPFVIEDINSDSLRTEQFWQALKLIPIPIIGVPWLLAQHLPGALIIAHEVGHNVEADFELSSTLLSMLDESMSRARPSIEPARRGAWRAWISEVFADVYATLTFGPAFVYMLVDLLASDKTTIETEHIDASDWGDYPTSYIRILIGIRVLLIQGHNKESDKIEASWRETYPNHAMKDFEKDVAQIVDTILQGPLPQFGGRTLTQLIFFGPADQSNATIEAERLLKDFKPATDHVRTLFAATALAFVEDPMQYGQANVQARVVKRVAEIQQDGLTRGSTDMPITRDVERIDSENANKLLSLLTTATTAPSSTRTCWPTRDVQH